MTRDILGKVTVAGTVGIWPNDRVRFSGDTNRMRRRVWEVTGVTTFETVLRLRPSRGYARHVRRMKQESSKRLVSC